MSFPEVCPWAQEAGLPASGRHPLSLGCKMTAGQPPQVGSGSADAGLCHMPGPAEQPASWVRSIHRAPMCQSSSGQASERGPGEPGPGPSPSWWAAHSWAPRQQQKPVAPPRELWHSEDTPVPTTAGSTAFISSSLHDPSGPWCWCPPEGHTESSHEE